MVREISNRSQSNVVGIVLIVGIVAISSVLILLAGGVVIEDSEERAETERVENSFRQLDRRIDSVAYGSRARAETDMDLRDRGGGTVQQRDTGRIVVTLRDSDGETTVLNESTGTILYTNDGTTVGYQSSAVFSGTGNATQVVSAPGMEYHPDDGEDPSLKLLLTQLRGELNGTTSTVEVERGPNSPRTNNVTDAGDRFITIRITSRFYVGWADYFRSILGGGVTVDHQNDTAIIRLFPGQGNGGIIAGIIQTANAEDLYFENTFATDSYDSSVAPYSSQNSENGRVIASGDLVLENGAELEGDAIVGNDLLMSQTAGGTTDVNGTVEVGGNVSMASQASIQEETEVGGNLTLDGQAEINDDATVGETLTYDSNQAQISGTATYRNLVNNTGSPVQAGALNDQPNPGVFVDPGIEYPNADGVITGFVERYDGSNSNDETTEISGDQLNAGCSCQMELESGNYYLTELDLDNGDELVLNTTNGSINIVVDGRVDIKKAAVRVQGPNRVNVFVNASDPSQDDFFFKKSNVSVPGDRSPQFWVYMRTDANAYLTGGGGGGGGTPTHFDGVIYGPSGDEPNGTTIRMEQGSEVFGAVVGNVEAVQNSAGVHFDRALLDEGSISGGFPEVEYLHVLFRVAEVDDD